MPNTSQSEKRVRQNIKTNFLKKSQRGEMRTLIKQFLTLIGDNNPEKAKDSFKIVVKRLQQLASKKVIKKNKASRLTSRLNKKLKNLVAV